MASVRGDERLSSGTALADGPHKVRATIARRALQGERVHADHVLGGRVLAFAMLTMPVVRVISRRDHLRSLAISRCRSGPIDDARQACEQWLRSSPDDAEAACLLAWCLRRLGRATEAAQLYREVLALHPNALVHVNLGAVLADLGHTDDAAHHFRQAIALAPRTAEAHANLALMLHRRGATADAIDHLRMAVALRPQQPAYRQNLGGMLADVGALEDAIEQFEHAARLQLDDAQARATLAEITARLAHEGASAPAALQ